MHSSDWPGLQRRRQRRRRRTTRQKYPALLVSKIHTRTSLRIFLQIICLRFRLRISLSSLGTDGTLQPKPLFSAYCPLAACCRTPRFPLSSFSRMCLFSFLIWPPNVACSGSALPASCSPILSYSDHPSRSFNAFNLSSAPSERMSVEARPRLGLEDVFLARTFVILLVL